MKIIISDSSEFECTASEEYVAIAIGRIKEYKNFRLFFRKTNEFHCFSELNSIFNDSETTLEESIYSRNVMRNICQFSDVTPIDSSKIALISLREDWNNNDLLLRQKDIFIRYHWYTTA